MLLGLLADASESITTTSALLQDPPLTSITAAVPFPVFLQLVLFMSNLFSTLQQECSFSKKWTSVGFPPLSKSLEGCFVAMKIKSKAPKLGP